MKILVSEDVPSLRALISLCLERAGHSVQVAADGRQAVELFAPGAYDAVLLATETPHMDGLQAAREMRAAELAAGAPPALVVALAVDPDSEDRHRCLEAGFSTTVGKPFKRADLLAAVAKAAPLMRVAEPKPAAEILPPVPETVAAPPKPAAPVKRAPEPDPDPAYEPEPELSDEPETDFEPPAEPVAKVAPAPVIPPPPPAPVVIPPPPPAAVVIPPPPPAPVVIPPPPPAPVVIPPPPPAPVVIPPPPKPPEPKTFVPAPPPDPELGPSIDVDIDKDFQELVGPFLIATRDEIASMRDAIMKTDYASIITLSRRMVGAGASYGFHGLSDEARKLESAAKNGDGIVVKARVDALGHYLSRLKVNYV